jgi:hypothetical protein
MSEETKTSGGFCGAVEVATEGSQRHFSTARGAAVPDGFSQFEDFPAEFGGSDDTLPD